MNRLIVIEGPENTGKTTLALRLVKEFRNDHDVLLMHSTKPMKKFSPEASLIFQSNSFLNQAEKIINICNSEFSSEGNVIIMDRAWYGEYVYGQLYRKEDPNDIVRMINEIDDYLYSSVNIHRTTLLVKAEPEFILANDDKKSFYSNYNNEQKLNSIANEIHMFEECFAKTVCQNKKLKNTFKTIDVDDKNIKYKFVDRELIFKDVMKFIEQR